MEEMSFTLAIGYLVLAVLVYIVGLVAFSATVHWPLVRLTVKLIKKTDKHKVLLANIATTIFAILLFTAAYFLFDYFPLTDGFDFFLLLLCSFLGLHHTCQFRNNLDQVQREEEEFTPDFRGLESLLKSSKK